VLRPQSDVPRRGRPYPRTVDLPGFVLRMKRRWVANGLPDYPLWIAGLIDSAALLTAIVVVAQRQDSVLPALGLAVLAGVPWVAELWGQASTWVAFVVLTGGSVLVLMTVYPVEYEFAPFLLILAAGHVTAVAGLARGAVVTATGELVVIVVWLTGNLAGPEVAIWAAGIAVGLDMGFVMRSQQLRIDAQAREHEVRERQAVLEERQRIARDVHDLVGHSLSVTMLHLTAARRDLEDAAAGQASVADALEALTEAERVGRRAMADIRSTVDLLGRDKGAATAPRGLPDLPALVAEFQRAGIDVTLTSDGDLTDVPEATGLGLYRIVQESLANVAKHAPATHAAVRLDLSGDPGELVVTNDLPRGARRNQGGSGLSGMAARADQLGASLSAGPRGRTWEVRVELPRGDETSGHACPLPRLSAPFRRTAPGPA
jgi:signal transduction histidine kinase